MWYSECDSRREKGHQVKTNMNKAQTLVNKVLKFPSDPVVTARSQV